MDKLKSIEYDEIYNTVLIARVNDDTLKPPNKKNNASYTYKRNIIITKSCVSGTKNFDSKRQQLYTKTTQ